MTKEIILERKNQLQKALDSFNVRIAKLQETKKVIDQELRTLVLQSNANSTATQECDFWLKEIEKVPEGKIIPFKQTIIDKTKKIK